MPCRKDFSPFKDIFYGISVLIFKSILFRLSCETHYVGFFFLIGDDLSYGMYHAYFEKCTIEGFGTKIPPWHCSNYRTRC